MDDSIIDMFLCATVQDTVPEVHCYTSHFFNNLLDKGKYVGFGPRGTPPDPPNTPHEDLQTSSFQAVENWSRHMDGGIDNVDDLFVPINVNNIHWLFLHVDFREKAIRLYNSLGLNTPGHRKYFLSMRKYLNNEEFKGTLINHRPAFAV